MVAAEDLQTIVFNTQRNWIIYELYMFERWVRYIPVRISVVNKRATYIIHHARIHGFLD